MKLVATRNEALRLASARKCPSRVYPTGKGWVVARLTRENADKGKLRGVTVRHARKH